MQHARPVRTGDEELWLTNGIIDSDLRLHKDFQDSTGAGVWSHSSPLKLVAGDLHFVRVHKDH